MVLASQKNDYWLNLSVSMFWKSPKKTTAKEAMGLMENGNALLIDVRLPMHYRKVLIKGALYTNRETVQLDLDLGDKTVLIICYCYSGFSSKTACRNLEQTGYENVYNLSRGFPAWKRAGGKTEN